MSLTHNIPSTKWSPDLHEQAAWRWLDKLITTHPEFIRTKAVAAKLARLNDPVLITGETGTGKEWLARGVSGGRNPLVVVNCAAITPSLAESELFGHVKGSFTGALRDHTGHFREAHGGCIFLDEINSLPLEIQAKLLRVLEHGDIRPVGSPTMMHVECKIVAASNVELKGHAGFRQDLYWRLAAYQLKTIPLNLRRVDCHLYLLNAGLSEDLAIRMFNETNGFNSGNYRQMIAEINRIKFEEMASETQTTTT